MASPPIPCADRRAANPFESCLRALALDAGLGVLLQYPIPVRDHVLHPDLVDPLRRLVLEADSFSHHADPSAFAQDCYRYNDLVVRGWRVLRFPWVAVVAQPWVARRTLAELVAPGVRRRGRGTRTSRVASHPV